ncbi:E3 ubiquitin-protein ligase RKP isoform X2 [Musa acuminata AAA Group]|uniref:E3 ubiquitin-protein ligase RKP isoform X2 n=1 Tax=Musa acuminata AAA Group TaxID=214697 RepID=UPI0031DC9AD3
MGEDSVRHIGISSGLAVLLSDDKPKGNPQKSRLISYCDSIGDHSVERTLEHIFDLPHKSVRPSSSLIDVDFIRSILNKQLPRFQQENDSDCYKRDGLSILDGGSAPNAVVIDNASTRGDIKTIRKPLLVESQTVFSSARANACAWKGKWMYEVTLETSGIQQLGWATVSCPFTDRKGVGDSEDSYAFDGKRVSKWNKDPMPYGQSWVVGDVIGCCIDLDSDVVSFLRNGVSLGVAFDRIQKMSPGIGYYPAISLSDGERCDLNFGARPFKHPVDGFLPIQAPPISRYYANYLLSCLTRLLEVRCLDKPDSAYFEKLRRFRRFAPLKELFYPISHGILEEFFNVIQSSEGSFEYIAWGALPSCFLGIFGIHEPHDYASLDQVLDLFLEFPGSDPLLQHLIVALSCSCKVAPLVLTECPYSGSYPYLALVCHILRRKTMMVLWWKSPDFEFSLEGFLSMKRPNKQDLHCLIPSVWWPGSCEDVGCESSMMLTMTALSGAMNKAFYYMSHQSQSISLLDDTDKQIRERSCIEQVKRLKEARNVYREELVDCVRQCAWYRISLFSRWKQRGMYATCMWVVELLLVLSNTDSIFCFVPEFYLESLVDSFHALRKSDPSFVSSAIFIKQGLASFVTFVVKHFNDPRILSADIKDLLLHSISSLVQCKDYLVAFEDNKEAIQRLPRALLLAFDNRSWIPVANIILRLCKGSGFSYSNHAGSSSSALFQVLFREACVHDEALFSSFLNRLFNTLSWTMTEFSVSIREMQENYQIGDLQQRKCSVVFDLSCNLAKILEFCTREIPQAFLLGPDMNLRRLTELIIFILNHIIFTSDSEFFDMSVRRPCQYQEKTNRAIILAPLVGIITSLMDAHTNLEQMDLNDVVGVFVSMDCPATVFQCLLGYNWSNVLRGDASLAKLAKLEEFSSNLRRRTEAIKRTESCVRTGDDEAEDCCCICYACNSDTMFEPCHHKSCHGCITRHLLNGQRCFFCNAIVTSVVKVEPRN